MKNPFPGVNPYVEAEGYWSDFHGRIINYLCEAVQDQLPDRYDARIEERLELLDPETGRTVRIPDVVITDPVTQAAPDSRREMQAAAGAAVVEVEQLPVEEYRESWIEIRDREENLVTSIEILSPANKSAGGLSPFQLKRWQLLEGGANLVDIDLLMTGKRLHFRQPLPAADYYVFVSRTVRRPKTEVIASALPVAIPPVPIPLRSPDPDLTIDLNQVYQTTFERGRYPGRLGYKSDLVHPDAGVVQWVRSRVAVVA